jgi:hypothetical protein
VGGLKEVFVFQRPEWEWVGAHRVNSLTNRQNMLEFTQDIAIYPPIESL